MRFVQPFYLLLMIPLLVGLIYSFRHVYGIAKGRKRFAFVLRFLLAGCLIVALAGPQSYRRNEGLCTIFLVDRSDSIADSDQKATLEFIQKAMQNLREPDQIGVVAFGKAASIDAAPGGRRSLPEIQSLIDRSASNLAAAIRLASAAFPNGKARRIVILSDGNETLGDAVDAAEVAQTDGIQIDHVALGVNTQRQEAVVEGIEMPAERRADQPFDLRVLIDSTSRQTALLDIDRDGRLLKTIQINLDQGQNAIVVSDRLAAPGFHKYRATLRATDDRDQRNNVGMGFVSVRGKPKVLILQGKESETSLADALRKQGVNVQLSGAGAVPSRPEELQDYDAVIFNDLNAESLVETQMRLMQSAVRDTGLGFAMIGGEDSFLPGGYYGSPIAEILPVDLNVRQRKSFPSTSVLIMVDASGSMGMIEDGYEKIRLAAKAAEETVKMLSPMDRVGVAGSESSIEFVAPMQKLTDKNAVISQIQKLSTGGGGIYIGPTVQRAEEVLNKEDSKVRHFILLADGADSEDPQDALIRIARMSANKITTSVVAIGDGPDVPLLKSIAAAGHGRFYLARRAGQLPAIFTQDAAVMSRSAIEEGAFLPKLNPSDEILRGVALGEVPPLFAYCLTDTRPLSKIGMRTGKDDPLLATWQYGLGTTLAFTSDAQPRWASKWVGWSGFAPFWAQAVRAISRQATLNDYQLEVRQEGGQGKIALKAFDRLGNPLVDPNLSITILKPGSQTESLSLSQDAPGSYSGSFDASRVGSYIVSIAEPSGAGKRISTRGFSVPYPAEYRTMRANRPLLARVSELTSGRALNDPAQALRPIANPGVSIADLWTWFVLAAALLLPLDIAARRIALPVAEIAARLAAFLRRRPARTIPQSEAIGRLHAAKQRAQQSSEPETPLAPIPMPTERKPREPVASQTGGSAGSKLLESKRRREQQPPDSD